MANPFRTLLANLLGINTPAPLPQPKPRQDGWENPITGLGTMDRDKLQGADYYADYPLPWTTLSNLYYGDIMAVKMVNAPVKAAFRKGYSLAVEDSPEGGKSLKKWANGLYKIDQQVQQASIWGRLWGGCLLVIGANDGQDLDKPLNVGNVKSIDWTLVVDRRYVQPITYEMQLGPRLGQPVTYRVNVQGGHSSVSAVIHHSRVIRFRGSPVDAIRSRIFGGWDQSVLQRPYGVMRDFWSAYQGAGVMLADASQGVFKVKGLVAMMASKEQRLLHERMTMLDLMRSVARSIMVDADGEDFTKVQTAFSGVPELLDRYMQLLSAATDEGEGGIPVSILMGRSPAGMNATGDMDLQSMAAMVQAMQTHTLEPQLRDVYRFLRMDPRAPQVEGDLTFTWEPLAVPTDKEDAEAYNTRATADIAYINAGVADPAAVAIARFGGGKYSNAAITVDVDKLTKELEAQASFDPPPPGAPQAPGKAPGAVEQGQEAEGSEGDQTDDPGDA